MGTHACHPGSGKSERGGSLGLTGQPASTASLLSSKPMRDSVSKTRRMIWGEHVWRPDPSLHTWVHMCKCGPTASVTFCILPYPPLPFFLTSPERQYFVLLRNPAAQATGREDGILSQFSLQFLPKLPGRIFRGTAHGWDR